MVKISRTPQSKNPGYANVFTKLTMHGAKQHVVWSANASSVRVRIDENRLVSFLPACFYFQATASQVV